MDYKQSIELKDRIVKCQSVMNKIMKDTLKTCSDKIKTRRAEKGITRKELALLSGMSYGKLTTFESAIALPNSRDLLILCSILELSPNDILGCEFTIGD